MSMLAGPKNRQKYSANPRGLDWVNDEEKIGQKLMEKMGWKKGKGLGANEDGSVDHVKVSMKMDSRGVGCTKQSVDNWIAHQDDFASILAGLNSTHASDDQTEMSSKTSNEPAALDDLISLENNSRNSKGRVHYQKFTKGKDLSLKEKTDLDCIFGKRKAKKESKEKNVETISGLKEGELANENDFGVKTVTSTTSVADYFAQKMAAMRRVKSEGQIDSISTQQQKFLNGDGESQRVSFKIESDDSLDCNAVVGVQSENDCSLVEQTNDSISKSGKTKKHKKKRNRSENVDAEIDSSPRVKQPKDDLSLIEIEASEKGSVREYNQHEVVQDNSPIQKKKKKHRDRTDEAAQLEASVEPEKSSVVEISSSKKKKHKKDKKHKHD